ncbi:MAG: hypothetical protein WCS31_07585 [Verrucomicrobiae bacterium]
MENLHHVEPTIIDGAARGNAVGMGKRRCIPPQQTFQVEHERVDQQRGCEKENTRKQKWFCQISLTDPLFCP